MFLFFIISSSCKCKYICRYICISLRHRPLMNRFITHLTGVTYRRKHDNIDIIKYTIPFLRLLSKSTVKTTIHHVGIHSYLYQLLILDNRYNATPSQLSYLALLKPIPHSLKLHDQLRKMNQLTTIE
jgi:hypothetical protein